MVCFLEAIAAMVSVSNFTKLSIVLLLRRKPDYGRDEVAVFQVPHQAVVDDAFQELAEATSERYRPKVGWLGVVLVGLRNGDDNRCAPLRWKLVIEVKTVKCLQEESMKRGMSMFNHRVGNVVKSRTEFGSFRKSCKNSSADIGLFRGDANGA
jgi:hypothetical protein